MIDCCLTPNEKNVQRYHGIPARISSIRRDDNDVTLEATNTKFTIFGCDPSGGLKLQSTTVEASMLTITPPMQLRQAC